MKILNNKLKLAIVLLELSLPFLDDIRIQIIKHVNTEKKLFQTFLLKILLIITIALNGISGFAG